MMILSLPLTPLCLLYNRLKEDGSIIVVLCLLGTQAYVFGRATPLDSPRRGTNRIFLCTVKGGGEILV